MGAPAGAGIMTAGLLLSKTLLRTGYSVYSYQEYPSLIKGGNNSYFINFSEKKVRSAKREIDILVCLDELTWKIHEKNLSGEAVVIYNENKFDPGQPQGAAPTIQRGIKYVGIPASDMVKKINAPEITINNLMLGAVMRILKLDLKILNEYVDKSFGEKHKDLIDENIKVVKAGYNSVVGDDHPVVPKGQTGGFVPTDINQIIISGNEAASLGIIASNCRFFAAYPMTPASAILHYLASKQEESGMIVKHPEDEIAAINMVVGASYAGVRSATATSGGGYALMVEGVGMAGMMETPVVIFVGMRTGPSTGLPTYTGQGDLNFVVNTSHGEFPRVVLCPGDIEEMFDFTRHAFNIADLIETPVFILYDKMLGESVESVEFKLNDKSDMSYKPYRTYKRLANSYEHDENGFATEDSQITKSQMERRMKKIDLIFQNKEKLGFSMTNYFGKENPDLLVISWGSNKGAILDAMDELKNKSIGFLQIVCAWPLDVEAIKKHVKNAKKIVSIECNYQGQMTNMIEATTGVQIANRLLKYDGRQFLKEEVSQFLISNF